MNLGKPIATGNTANIYLENNKAIKIYHKHIPHTEAAYEAGKQNAAYACGLPVPKVLEVNKNSLVMEYVNGKTLGDVALENEALTEQLIELSVEVQRNIHSKISNGLEPMSEKLERQIKAVECLDEKTKVRLIDSLHSMTYEPKLCHGDFHLYNLVQTEDRVVVIDWVDASVGDIRADVYRTYLLYSHVSEEIAEMYLHFYCKKSGMTKEAIFQWAPIIAAARLSEKVASESQERLLGIVRDYN